MRIRPSTCRDCGAGWSAVAEWCGHCGALLATPVRPRAPWRPPAWATASIALLLLVATVAFLGISRSVAPDAASDVELPRSTSTTERSVPTTPVVPAGERCRADGRALACVQWTSDAATRDVVPVSAGGILVGAADDGAVGIDVATGRLRWRTADIGDLIWLFATDETAQLVLAVDQQRRLLTLRASDGVVLVTLPFVRPVFPGIVGDHLAVLREISTDVLDVRTGDVVVSVPRTGPSPSGRLSGPDRFASWVGSTMTAHELVDGSTWSVDLPLDAIEIGGDADTVVATLTDGSLAAIDVEGRDLRWVSPPAVADGETLLVTPRTVVTVVTLGGTDTVRFLDTATGIVRRQITGTDVAELRALDDDHVLVVDELDDAIGLVVLAPRGSPGDRTVDPIVGGSLPVVVADGMAMVGGSDGATLVDLRTGDVRWSLGIGTADAVSARTPTVWDDRRLVRGDLPDLP